MSIELSEDGRVKLAASSELQSARKRLRLLEDTQVPQLSSALRLSKRELAQAQGALRREEEMRQAAEEAAAVVRSQLATVRDLLRQGGQGKGKRAARASLNRVRESLLGCNLLFPEGQASHRASLMLEEEEDEEDEDYEEDEEDEESAADLAAAHQVSFAAEEEGASAQASPASPAPQPVRSILRRPGSRRERASSVPESMVLRGRLAASPQHPPSSPLARASHTAVSPAAAAEPHTPPGDGEAAGGVRGRAMNRSISMSALSARQTRALAGSRVRCHMLEESTAVRPGKCGVCSKNIGFKARHLHCHQCQQSFHDMCQPLVRADCRPPAFGTPEAKKRRAPPLGSNLAAAVSAYSRNGLVPGFVADAVATLNRRAVHVENIFEAPPSTAAQPKLLTTKFFLGDSRPNFDTVACIHDVAHALLLFLGQLDEPLTTIPLYESFKAAIDNKRSDRAVHEALALVLAKLPPVNFHTLHLIVTHLRLYDRVLRVVGGLYMIQVSIKLTSKSLSPNFPFLSHPAVSRARLQPPRCRCTRWPRCLGRCCCAARTARPSTRRSACSSSGYAREMRGATVSWSCSRQLKSLLPVSNPTI